MSRRPKTCPRRGCGAPLTGRVPTCDPCWREIPAEDRAHILQLGREGRYGARDEARRAALRKLPRKIPGAPSTAAASTQAYARIARITGDRTDEEDAA